MPRRQRTTITSLLVLTLLFTLATLGMAADSERDQVKAFKQAMKSREEGDRLKAVAEFSVLPGKSVGKELRKVVSGDRSDRVRAAAARAIGSRGNRKDLSFLLSSFRSLKKRPVALAGAIDAVGLYGEPKTAKAVYDAGRLWLKKHKYPALATIRALGRIRCSESVELLLKMYDLTHARSGYGPGGSEGGSIDKSAPSIPGSTSDDTQAALADFRPHVAGALQGLTGEMLDDLDNWKEWWEENEDTFDPDTVKLDPNKALRLTNSEYSYQMKRPSSEWKWSEKPTEGFNRTALLTEDGDVMARLDILAYSKLTREPRDVKTLAEEEKARLKKRFTSLTRETFDEQVKVDGSDGIRHTVAGNQGLERTCYRITFLTQRDFIYVLWFTLREPSSRYTLRSVQEFEESFRFLK